MLPSWWRKQAGVGPSTELLAALDESGALVLETRDQGLRRAEPSFVSTSPRTVASPMNWSGSAGRKPPLKKDAKAVLDASAVLAILQDEPGAETLRPLLPRSVVCSVNLAEVLAKLVREGTPAGEAVAAMTALHMQDPGFDSADAERSAAYVAKGISLGDRCFLAAAGKTPAAPRLHNFR